MFLFVISAVVTTGIAVATTIATTAASLVVNATVATVRLGVGYLQRGRGDSLHSPAVDAPLPLALAPVPPQSSSE